MSAATFHEGSLDTPEDDQNGPEARVVGRPVVVRRNAGLAALVGAGASAIAIAYLWRATTSGAPADWALCVLMAGLAAIYLAHLVDARTPLLVADDLGMRIRLGNQWRGLPWDAVGTVVVQPRRGLLRDGRLVFDPQELARSLDGLDGRGRRAAALNRRLYGAPLAVPLSLTTTVSARAQGLVEDLTALAGQRADIVTGTGRALAAPPEQPAPDDDRRSETAPVRRSIHGGLGTVVSRAANGRSRDLDSEASPVPEQGAEPRLDDGDDEDGLPSVPTVRSAVQLRAARRGLRAQVEAPVRALRSASSPAEREEAGLENVRPIATLGDPVEAMVIEEFAVQPASDPVIGPELAAARNRVGLTVDELADRTRIRPHVLESIEVDDFVPCGGDFYARGHLRTLARVLGRDPAPLLAHFDRRYATAPIDARRVFEAELATGMTAGSRRTAGGPNWALLVGVVLALVLTWGVVRLFAAEPPERLQSPVPSLNGSAGPDGGTGVEGTGAAGAAFSSASVTLRLQGVLQGSQDGSSVVVRDRSGRVVWQGRLEPGQRRTVRAAPPVDVRAENAGAVLVAVDGQDQGALGAVGSPVGGSSRALRLAEPAGARARALVRTTSGPAYSTTPMTAPPAHSLQPSPPATVALVTLGCARNDVDSEELAGRLEAGGFLLVDDPEDAQTVVVNTCGFVEAAKKDSVDTLLAAADLKSEGPEGTRAVVAVGCLAERYGKDLAESLPEADAVLGFDDYPDIAARLRSLLAGEQHHPHTPQDRRRLLPISPAARDASAVVVPGHTIAAPDLPVGAAPDSGPRAVRRRLDGGPMAPLKLASGCDRRCTFCAIPSFRGSFVSRRPSDVLGEARWLAEQGVSELFLVSENSTSYGKDLGDLRLLETLLPELAAIDGVERVRVSYLQPAETRPGLVTAIATTPGVAAYFDLSFQHASNAVLRRMRRFGDPESFLGLIDQARGQAPLAGIRSNVIVGFPGETEADLATLCDFLVAARLDVVGVFGYSDEDGTEAASYDGKLDEDEIRDRTEHVSRLVEELTSQRAEDRVGERVDVLLESVSGSRGEGRGAHQGPDVDGTTSVEGLAPGTRVGALVTATVTGSDGADLLAEAP